MAIKAIAVVASNGVIGDGRDQPFKFKEDWARFKEVTMGHPLIMGRRTHDAMGLLPGRTSIVLTSRPEMIDFPLGEDGRPRGYAVDSLAKALEVAMGRDEEIYVIGGGEVYRLAWDQLDELDITQVHAEAEGEVTFPEIDPAIWEETSRDQRGEFDFVHYARRRAGIGQEQDLEV